MSKECLVNYEVTDKLQSTNERVDRTEYSTVESCIFIGADESKLKNYPTLYECPADDDIVAAPKYDWSVTPDTNSANVVRFEADPTWIIASKNGERLWGCNGDRSSLYGESGTANSYLITNGEPILGNGDLILINFKPISTTTNSIGLVSIQDIDDNCIGLLYFVSGTDLCAQDLYWNTEIGGFDTDEMFYEPNISRMPGWIAVWRSPAGVYFNWWYEEFFDNVGINGIIDYVISTKNDGILWVSQSKFSNGTNIQGDYINLGQPYWNYSVPSDYENIYWANVKYIHQKTLGIKGFYGKRNCM